MCSREGEILVSGTNPDDLHLFVGGGGIRQKIGVLLNRIVTCSGTENTDAAKPERSDPEGRPQRLSASIRPGSFPGEMRRLRMSERHHDHWLRFVLGDRVIEDKIGAAHFGPVVFVLPEPCKR
jgi:hypothetical protein